LATGFPLANDRWKSKLGGENKKENVQAAISGKKGKQNMKHGPGNVMRHFAWFSLHFPPKL